MSNRTNDTLTALDGVMVGHYTDAEGGTGLTVVLFETPATGAVDISGMATSSRQIDSLEIMHPGAAVHAVCLAGGSAFGLDAASGVVRYLEESGIGIDLTVARLPVVPTAVIYDLSFMDPCARPVASMAYEACRLASPDPVEQGCVGAGTGATAGKIRGVVSATKSGLGSSVVSGVGGVKMGSLVVANCFGDVLDEHGNIIAGAREGKGFLNSFQTISRGEVRTKFGAPGNTTLCVLVTDARLDKISAAQVARMGGNGLARHISPYNTPLDGDMVFCFSIGNKEVHPLHLGVLAAQAAKSGLLNAVRCAHSMGGLPASRDLVD
jgi:L-aminopeptidase/D-esterase-like protein